MKNLFLIAFLFVVGHAWTQPVTEENYQKEFKAMEEKFSLRADTLRKFISMKKYTAKRDSLVSEYKKLVDEFTELNLELALRYASVPSGLQMCFWNRLTISQDTLKAVLKRIPKQMRKSEYGRAIAMHLSCPKVGQGDKAYDFRAMNAQGRPFRLSQWKGKQVLLLYGGLGCMGSSGRKYLDEFYGRTSRENFEIVVFWPASGQAELTALAKEYPSDFPQVSDFKGDVTPVKIRYEAQATPTCFFIDRDGRLLFKSVGLNPEGFESAMK